MNKVQDRVSRQMSHPLDKEPDPEPPDGYPYITLTKEEREVTKKIAQQIENDHKNHPGTVALSDNYHIVGTRGEYAFAKWLDLDIDRMYLRDSQGDGGIDFIANGNKLTIDTKTRDAHNNYPEPDLGVPVRQDLDSDIYVLIEKNGNYYSFIGWATKKEIKEADREVFKLENRVIERDQLRMFN